MPARVTRDQFIERARALHGAQYDYSKVVYQDNRTKVTITCVDHGDFEQTPANHLKPSKCPDCGVLSRRAALVGRSKLRSVVTTDVFVARAKAVHGNCYEYGDVDYRNSKTPVVIRCPDHGHFSQRPGSHLAGSGCPSCAHERQSTSRLLNSATFVEQARAVHGDRYDYAKSNYERSSGPVTITCRIHGDFRQRASSHTLLRQGCKECQMDAQRMRREAFIEKCAGRYDVAYDYSFITADFVLALDRVKIQCPEHGTFEVGSRGHMDGRAGCPGCNGGSRHEREIARLLDEWGIEYKTQWSHESLRDKARLRFDFAISSRRTLIEYDGAFHFKPIIMPGMTRADAERVLHETQKRDRIKDEWAARDGWCLIRLSRPNRIEADLCSALNRGNSDPERTHGQPAPSRGGSNDPTR